MTAPSTRHPHRLGLVGDQASTAQAAKGAEATNASPASVIIGGFGWFDMVCFGKHMDIMDIMDQ